MKKSVIKTSIREKMISSLGKYIFVIRSRCSVRDVMETEIEEEKKSRESVLQNKKEVWGYLRYLRSARYRIQKQKEASC